MSKSIHRQFTRLLAAAGVVCFFAVTQFSALADAARNYSVGNSWFGATAGLTYGDWARGTQYKGKFAANIEGNVLRKKVSLASGNSTLTVQQPSQCKAEGNLKLAKRTVTSWNRSFSGSTEFSTPSLFGVETGGSYTFAVGPVPLKVSAKAQLKTYAKGSVVVSYSPGNSKPTVRAAVGPAFDAGASGSVGVNLGVASAGVEGSVTIVSAALLGSLDYVPRSRGNPSVIYALTVQGQATSGKIEAYEKIGICPLCRKWKQTIAEFAGYPFSFVVTRGSRPL